MNKSSPLEHFWFRPYSAYYRISKNIYLPVCADIPTLDLKCRTLFFKTQDQAINYCITLGVSLFESLIFVKKHSGMQLIKNPDLPGSYIRCPRSLEVHKYV